MALRMHQYVSVVEWQTRMAKDHMLRRKSSSLFGNTIKAFEVLWLIEESDAHVPTLVVCGKPCFNRRNPKKNRGVQTA